MVTPCDSSSGTFYCFVAMVVPATAPAEPSTVSLQWPPPTHPPCDSSSGTFYCFVAMVALLRQLKWNLLLFRCYGRALQWDLLLFRRNGRANATAPLEPSTVSFLWSRCCGSSSGTFYCFVAMVVLMRQLHWNLLLFRCYGRAVAAAPLDPPTVSLHH
ncbi:hypothetical protein J6590_011171 [Homalodisca vitripennis]|nr:hypothetical protein J6590_011171 [Homalodisca vitripennis]